MTLNEMTLHLADALNLSSPEAKTRIGRNINVRYKRVTSAIGLITTRREEVTGTTTIDSRFVTFSGIEKLDTVFRKTEDELRNIILPELTNDEMLTVTPTVGLPNKFSVFTVAPRSVTIMLDSLPDDETTIYAHGLADVSTLSNTDSPAFPESFHDILIHGVMADEYRKMEKPSLAKESEMYYEQRLSDLKMFIAKSAYLEIYNGKNSKAVGWWDTSRSL